MASHPRSPDYTILRDGRDVWPAWIELIERMPARFIVGTDAPVRSRESDVAKIRGVQSFLAQLSPDARQMVARENLERIVGRAGTGRDGPVPAHRTDRPDQSVISSWARNPARSK